MSVSIRYSSISGIFNTSAQWRSQDYEEISVQLNILRSRSEAMPPALLQERKNEFHGFLEGSHGFLDRFVGEIVPRALERTDAFFFFFFLMYDAPCPTGKSV